VKELRKKHAVATAFQNPYGGDCER